MSAELLQLGGLATDQADALQRVDQALGSGLALERFARMVQALGGPADVCERPTHYLPIAPVQRQVLAPRAGWVRSMATRDIGLLLIALGGGRQRASDVIDARVGLSAIAPLGQRVERGSVLAVLHAADDNAADMAQAKLLELIEIADEPLAAQAVMLERLLA